MINAYKARQHEDAGADRLEDAFQPVRQLVGHAGPYPSPGTSSRQESLIPPDVYDAFRQTTAAVWSRIAVRSAADRWGFFCLRGQEKRAPRWVFLEHGKQPTTPGHLDFQKTEWTVETQLRSIAERLRTRIPTSKPVGDLREARRWNDIEGELASMIARIRTNEWELLSNKARHGLTLLKEVLYRYRMDAPAGSERSSVCSFLRAATDPDEDPAANLHELADEWLGIVQPLYLKWKQQQVKRGTRDPVRLKGMTALLLQDPLSTDVLRQLAASVQAEEPMRRRIVAAIIAIPVGEDSKRV